MARIFTLSLNYAKSSSSTEVTRLFISTKKVKGYKIQTLVEKKPQGKVINDEKLPDYSNVWRVWKFFLAKKKYSEYCNHAEWLNYDDLKIDVSAVIVSGGHYFAKSSALTKAHGWTRILGENIILSFVLLYSVGIISGASMSVKTLGDSGLGGLLVWHHTHLAKTHVP